MKHKLLFLALLISLLVPTFTSTSTFASSGALKKASIKKCPDGLHYGYHGKDNHWHQAEKSDTSSGWSAIGPELPSDPCPTGSKEATPSTAKHSQPTNNTNNSSSSPSASSNSANTTNKTAKPAKNNTQQQQTQPKASNTQPATPTSNTKTASNTKSTKNVTKDKQIVQKEEKNTTETTLSQTKTNPPNDTLSQSSNSYKPSREESTSKDDSTATGIIATAIVSVGGYAVYRKKKK